MLEKDKDNKEKLQVNSVVNKIIFQSAETGFTVATIDIDAEEYKITGVMPALKEGGNYEFLLEDKVHDSYGFQFNVLNLKPASPSNPNEIINFLASGAFKGIGPANANLIVEKFGDKTLDILKNDIDKLIQIKGIGKKSIERIRESVEEHFDASETLYELSKFGFTLSQSKRVFDAYGDVSPEIVRENPYRLLIEVRGMSFKIIDEIALKNGFVSASPERLEALIFYELSVFTYQDGHLYTPKVKLYRKIRERVSIEDEALELALQRLEELENIIQMTTEEDDIIYLAHIFEIESDTLADLCRIKDNYIPKNSYKNLKASIDLSPGQENALKSSFDEGIFILTGAAGTGKTTILKEMVNMARLSGLSTVHAAPTGRAASRMEEVIGYEASTIHRLLQYQYDEDESKLYFLRNEGNPIEADIVFVDEASMVDILLFSHLLKAIRSGAMIVLIGDPNQLPPVGPGSPFVDMINSRCFNHSQLKEIHRQSGGSDILKNAHGILLERDFVYNRDGGDFYYFTSTGENNTLDILLDLVSKKIPKVFNFEPLESISVISPIKRGLLGVENLNTMLQRALNPHSHKLYFDKFALGDKVMQIRNNYNAEWKNRENGEEGTGVFNGETGFIVSASKNELNVRFFDGKEIIYTASNVRKELDLAYAMTVHKSQGNEFEVIVMPSFYFPPLMQNKNLMYTALTRAKKIFVLVGNKYHFEMAAKSKNKLKRYSLLEKNILNVSKEK